MADLPAVAAHFAVSSVFEHYGREFEMFCYPVEVQDIRSSETGRSRLVVGRIRLSSDITTESDLFAFGVVYFGEHNLHAAVGRFQSDSSYEETAQELRRLFEAPDFQEITRRLHRHFGESTYSLKSLFKDEQRKIMGYILEGTLADIEQVFRQLYEHHNPPMRFLTEIGNPLPKAFKDAAEFIINTDLRRVLADDPPDLKRVEGLFSSAASWNAELDTEGHAYLLRLSLRRMMESLSKSPDDESALAGLTAAVALVQRLPFPIDLGEVQHLFYRLIPSAREEHRTRTEAGDAVAARWLAAFDKLGDQLRVRTG